MKTVQEAGKARAVRLLHASSGSTAAQSRNSMADHILKATPETVLWGKFAASTPPVLTVALRRGRVVIETLTGPPGLLLPEGSGMTVAPALKAIQRAADLPGARRPSAHRPCRGSSALACMATCSRSASRRSRLAPDSADSVRWCRSRARRMPRIGPPPDGRPDGISSIDRGRNVSLARPSAPNWRLHPFRASWAPRRRLAYGELSSREPAPAWRQSRQQGSRRRRDALPACMGRGREFPVRRRPLQCMDMAKPA